MLFGCIDRSVKVHRWKFSDAGRLMVGVGRATLKMKKHIDTSSVSMCLGIYIGYIVVKSIFVFIRKIKKIRSLQLPVAIFYINIVALLYKYLEGYI